MKVIIFILIFISSHSVAQNLYFGIPKDVQSVNSGDLIITNSIHWEDRFYWFSDIGKQQLIELADFLSQIENKKTEIRVYFFSGSADFAQKITEKISIEIYRLLIEENDNLKAILNIKPCGSTKPLLCDNDDAFLFRMNTRIEIEIK